SQSGQQAAERWERPSLFRFVETLLALRLFELPFVEAINKREVHVFFHAGLSAVFVLGKLRGHFETVEVANIREDLFKDDRRFIRGGNLAFSLYHEARTLVEIQIDIAMPFRLYPNALRRLLRDGDRRQQGQFETGFAQQRQQIPNAMAIPTIL